MGRWLRIAEFLDSRHIKVVRFKPYAAAIFTPQEIPQGHSAAGKIRLMKISVTPS
jgi:hypothetical protein